MKNTIFLIALLSSLSSKIYAIDFSSIRVDSGACNALENLAYKIMDAHQHGYSKHEIIQATKDTGVQALATALIDDARTTPVANIDLVRNSLSNNFAYKWSYKCLTEAK